MVYNVSQSFAVAQPPLLVFTLCLMAFGLTMVALAYIIGEREIPNPDIQMDWNKLFSKISELKFCMPQNVKENDNSTSLLIKQDKNSTQNITELHSINEEKISAVLSNVVGENEETIDSSSFVEVSVKAVFKMHGKNSLENLPYFKGTFKGKYLGLLGKYSLHAFNISLALQFSSNYNCNNKDCDTFWDTCVTINLPSEFLQETKHRSPSKCEMENAHFLDGLPFSFAEIRRQSTSDTCLELEYSPDAKFTELLSLHDRSIVNLHLMHTSYFMFVMVMTLICYSLIRGRYRHSKALFEQIPAEA